MTFVRAVLLAFIWATSPIAQIHYVDIDAVGRGDGTSWGNAFTSLQVALVSASDGDQIWVAEGIYRPTEDPSDVSASFRLINGVEIYGGFEGTESSMAERDLSGHVTVLSGDLAGDDDPVTFKSGQTIQDNSGHVVVGLRVGATSVLDGFTITGGIGRPLLEEACDPDSGGGLVIIDSSPVVRNCTLSLNRADNGGACYIGGSSSPSFLQCAFVGNFSKANGPAAIWVCSASVTFDGCRFEGNGVNVNNSGGAILIGGSVVLIRGCDFINNQSNWSGGAVGAVGASEVLIEDSRFFGNRAYIGGALHAISFMFEFDNNIIVKNSLFSGNESLGSYGGAVGISTSSATIENCTIVGNRSYYTSVGAGIAVEGLSPEVSIKNSIVWGNSADSNRGESTQIWDGMEFFDVTVGNSCIQGLGSSFEGNGNIGSDPLLVNSTGLDGIAGTPDDELRLSPGSPCVDAGDPSSSGVGLDIVGMPRRLDGNLDTVGIVDIGANEFGNVHLKVDGGLVPGGTVTIAVDSAVPLLGYLIVARSPGWQVLEPFGPALFDLNGSWIRVQLGVLPYEQVFSMPRLVPAAFDLTLQAFGIQPVSGAGNMSNSINMAVTPL